MKKFISLLILSLFLSIPIYAGYGGGGGGRIGMNNPATADLDMSDYDIDVTAINAKDGDGLSLLDDGGDGIFIEDGGNIGVKTTNPRSSLEVIGSFTLANTAGDNYFTIARDNGSGYLFFQGYQTTFSGFVFKTNLGEKLRITNIGRVGINTSNPSTKFEVKNGSITISGTDANLIVGGNVGISTSAPIAQLAIQSNSAPTEYIVKVSSQDGSRIFGITGDGITTFNSTAIYAQLSDSTDQTFPATGTAQSITFDTNDEIAGITHSVSVSSENITIVTSGVYSIVAQPQVTAGAGDSGYFHMWLQKNTGGGFADIANSNVELILASNDEDVIPLIIITNLNAGDVIRVRASVGDTGIKLDAQTPGSEPAIPSIIFSMYYIGK